MSDDVKEARRLVAKYPFFDHDTARRELAGWAGSGGLSRLVSKIDEMQKENERLLSLEAMQEVTRKWQAAERTAADKAAEVEKLRGRLGAIANYTFALPDNSDDECNTLSSVVAHMKAIAKKALSPPPTDSTTFPTPSPMTARIAEPYEPSAETQATLKAIEENRRRAHALASTTFVGNDSFPTPSVPGNHLLSGPEEG